MFFLILLGILLFGMGFVSFIFKVSIAFVLFWFIGGILSVIAGILFKRKYH